MKKWYRFYSSLEKYAVPYFYDVVDEGAETGQGVGRTEQRHIPELDGDTALSDFIVLFPILKFGS